MYLDSQFMVAHNIDKLIVQIDSNLCLRKVPAAYFQG